MGGNVMGVNVLVFTVASFVSQLWSLEKGRVQILLIPFG